MTVLLVLVVEKYNLSHHAVFPNKSISAFGPFDCELGRSEQTDHQSEFIDHFQIENNNLGTPCEDKNGKITTPTL